MTAPSVFISYSRKDEVWKDRLVRQLQVLALEGAYEVWDDRQIAAGDAWGKKLETAMASARVAILLISADFLTSKFIRGTEVPRLLQRRAQEGVRVIPLIVQPCPWRRVPWLEEINARPKDGRALAEGSKVRIEKDLAALAEELADLLAITATTQAPTTSAPRLDLGRLPTAGKHFLGREAEMDRLDAAWEDPRTHVLTYVAFGGVGKTSLLHRWLDRMAAAGWRGATRVLDWSFYEQGTSDEVTSAEPFLDHALRFFGDPAPQAGSLHDRGTRLAGLIRQERTLLLLDGIEPLQYPPGVPEIAGKLKDSGLAGLLKGLAMGNPGLCVVTTRLPITDLEGSPTTAPQIDLENLSPEAAIDLLRKLGVNGSEKELAAAVSEFQYHALTLTLLGSFLGRAHGGDVRKRREIGLHQAAERQGGHALRVIAAYTRWLGEGPELSILRLLGLFDRPASAAALRALRAAPAILGLTDRLFKKKGWWKKVPLPEEDWQSAVATLREHRLLLPEDAREPGVLDAHPLVRAYFGEHLEEERRAAWEEGNRRLYEHLRQAAPEYPETLEAMQPLYAAVVHGCRAGRQQEAMTEVYWRRIRRGKEFYSGKKLGAFGSELPALSGFFDRAWSQPSARLTAADQGFVLNAAAFALRALGRLREAVEPMQAGLAAAIAQEDWKNAARDAGNLSELTLTLGEVSRAVEYGAQSVELADRSGDAFQRIGKRAKWADALHQAGRSEESAAAFREAEALQAEEQAEDDPQDPRLYSLRGYQYCDLLLGRGEPETGWSAEEAERFRQACREVVERAAEAMQVAESNHWLLDIALDHLSLGRAHLGLAQGMAESGEERAAGLAQAAEHMEHAVAGLRRAGTEHHLPRGLLARAALRRVVGDVAGARADLTEAQEIAERGRMRLHACDAHLEWARLCRALGDGDGEKKHRAQARALVEATGYERRRAEAFADGQES